jgi:RNA polymerase sigma-70 factor (ECF subfamily)
MPARAPELTARFVNDALPDLNRLNDLVRRMTGNTVDAENLLQETLLKAYAAFKTFPEASNLRVWLCRVMTDLYINGLRRSQHRPREYLSDQMTDRQRAAQGLPSPRGPRWAEIDAVGAFPGIELAGALTTLPVRFPLTVCYAVVSELRCRQTGESRAGCEDSTLSRRHRGRQGFRAPVLTMHKRPSAPARRRLRGHGVDTGSSFWRWVPLSSSLYIAQQELGALRLFP